MNHKRLELLAPAGTLEAFAAAVDAGADAVYIGAPAANARALARDFTPAEIAAMIDYAHGRGVRVYAAMNSLLKDEDLPRAAATVELLAGLGIDALIIQDLGLHRLCQRFFPELRLHASTLMGAHNSLAVRQLAALGMARVVLARELSLAEIAAISRQSQVELEVFVHGAMCFSYSGLCLFSSYLGGMSSLRGRCVQPCRRAYRWAPDRAGKSAYLFSMNDLEALELLPELRQAGVGSIKIEGRMKSAHYVDRVVRAYRRVIDALGHDAGGAEALAEGRALLAEAMGRRTGAGYLRAPFKDLVSPGQSGNIGHFLGKLSGGRGRWGTLKLRCQLHRGDRLRLHQEPAGERTAFTVKEIRVGGPAAAAERPPKDNDKGRGLAEAAAGREIEILLPQAARAGDSLYKVDLAGRRQMAARCPLQVGEQHRRQAAARERSQLRPEIQAFIGRAPAAGAAGAAVSIGAQGLPKAKNRRPDPARPHRGRANARQDVASLPLWLRLDDPQLLPTRLPLEVVKVVLTLSPASWPRLAAAGKAWRRLGQRLVWALPPVILEDDLPFYREKIAHLRERDCHAWQLGHLGQLLLFDEAGEQGAAQVAAASGRRGGKAGARRPSLVLYGDYTLNILNRLARASYQQAGLRALQAAIETDRANLLAMLATGRPAASSTRSRKGVAAPAPLGLTVYGRPPLFTARLDSVHFRYQVPLLSPREEKFVLWREHDLTLALAAEPFSLLPRTAELAAAGLAYGVIDLRRQKITRQDLLPLLRRAGKSARQGERAAVFNFFGGLA